MSRFVILGVILLPLGLALSVAVAWACALWSPGHTREILCPDDLALFPQYAIPGYEVLATRHSSFGFTDIYITAIALGGIPLLGAGDHHLRCGWPYRALSGTWSYPGQINSGLRLPTWASPRTSLLVSWGLLPLRPLWPGLALNAVLYSVCLAVLLFAPRIVRRHIRVARQMCPTCGYPTGTSAICSECGSGLPTRVA